MKKRHLDDAELATLKTYLEKNHTTEGLFVELVMRTGCRIDEAARIEFGHINPKTGTVTIHHGSKGSNARSAPVTKELCQRFLGLQEQMPDTTKVIEMISKASFESQKRALQRCWEYIRLKAFGVGGNKLGIHCLRHTFARRVHELSGGDLMAVQLGLGHKSLSSTQHYLKHIQYSNFKDIYREAI